MLLRSCVFLLLSLLASLRTHAQPTILDTMDDPSLWKVVTSEGVHLKVSRDDGLQGGSIRLDYDFTTGAGYGIIERPLTLDLPPNFEFAFDIRGESPANNLEFKIIRDDPPAAGSNAPAAENVWWVNKKGYQFPVSWTHVSYKRRHFTFGWGPDSSTLTKTTRLQIAIASFKGGKGSVWLDQLTFRPMDPPASEPFPLHANASTEQDEAHAAAFAVDGNMGLAWRSKEGNDLEALLLDLGSLKEFGGLVIDWEKDYRPLSYTIRLSDDGGSWFDVRTCTGLPPERSWVALADSQARYIRLMFDTSADKRAVGIRELHIRDVNFASTPNAYYASIAKESRLGLFPQYFLGKQTYWTVVGAAEEHNEALLSEHGAVEFFKQGFSVEPFIVEGDRLVTWADATCRASMRWASGSVPAGKAGPGKPTPVVRVTRESREETLFIESSCKEARGLGADYFAPPERGAAKLALAIRPFQVNPPWQNLNYEGGFSPIHSIRVEGRDVFVDSHHLMLSHAPSQVVCLAGPQGDAVGDFPCGHVTPQQVVKDPSGFASAILIFEMGTIGEGGISLSFVSEEYPTGANGYPRPWPELNVDRVRLTLPATNIVDTFKAQQLYILINRDGPAIQPGSRTYERSWIRDGCLTSAALLATGHTAEARAFIDWYGNFQFDSGKIPCVVDKRGPDPVPENDSHGEYIFALMNNYRFTKDRPLLRQNYPRVRKAVAYIESLIAQRSTPAFSDEHSTRQEPGKPAVPVRAFQGLVPESISHEGYSAKPMHSYWDDFFTLRGLKDAVAIATILNQPADAARFTTLRDTFQHSLENSIRITQQAHKIEYIPGCVELGDFDSTSTTIALWPCAADRVFPREWFTSTFDKYWEFFQTRKSTDMWEAFTPYELRHIGSLVRLGQRDRAVEALEWYLNYQRPAGWHHWAEVVWHDPETPKFIGDMPHTWCGSDFLNSLRTMLLYERESPTPPTHLSEGIYDDEDALVLFAGIPKSWADQGVDFTDFPTHFGTLSASLKSAANYTKVELSGDLCIPSSGILLDLPLAAPPRSIRVNGKDAMLDDTNHIVVRTLPANVVILY